MTNRRHIHSFDRAICMLEAPIEMIGETALGLYEHVDCPNCLRRAIAEGEERNRVLRDLLAKVTP